MALFQVPGWSLPSAPVTKVATQTSKKRKRPSGNDPEKTHNAEVNLVKLVKKLKRAGDSEEKISKPKSGKNGKRNNTGRAKLDGAETDITGQSPKLAESSTKPADSAATEYSNSSVHLGSKKLKKPRIKNDAKATDQPTLLHEGTPALTTLQRGMKQSLDGARFRWINEVLYKSDSAEAHQMMQDDPKVYEEYHTGFRHQVHAWPTNPVSHYITTLSSYPAKTVIADLGCGDAALARALVPKGLTVLSFDLVSDGAFVVEADTHVKIPLPGSEGGDGQSEGHVVDVVVCALSLMGTNWPNCIREAWRILKPGCELKIAEVASRFTSVDAFISLVNSIGFELTLKDDQNTHFTLFEFQKTARKEMNEKKWATMMSKGSTLKPCEYKRR